MNEITYFRDQPDVLVNIEAEQALLGAILLDNDCLPRVADLLTGKCFGDPVHQRVWDWASARIRAGHIASPVAGKLVFEADEGMRQLGGASYLVRIASAAPAAAMVRDYALLVLDAHQRRQAIKALDEARSALLAGQDIPIAQGILEAASTALVGSEGQRPTTSFLKAVTRSLEQTFAAYQGDKIGLGSGIQDFDALTGGMYAADLVIIAGGPSMGKTSLALGIVKWVAERGNGVCVVSLEMSEDSLAQRLISSESRVPYFLLRNGSMSEDQAKAAVLAAQKIQDLPIEIVAPHVRDIGAIFSVVKDLQKRLSNSKHPLSMVVVDYLQLVRSPAKDRFQMVAEVSMGLKALAKMLGVPVIALSQISRDVASRDDKRPRLSDLRESAQIEQDADVVIFTHRDFYYLEREGPPKGKDGKVKDGALVDHDAAMKASKYRMDLICAKHRSGAIGDRKIGCDITTNRFWSLHGSEDARDF